jgi:hypothetical protein
MLRQTRQRARLAAQRRAASCMAMGNGWRKHASEKGAHILTPVFVIAKE